jgi:hypothetical protein
MLSSDLARSSAAPPAICVAQLGARMHYAVPRVLHAAGMLERFFTDATGTSSWARALSMIPERLRPCGLKRLLGRVPVGIPRERITAFERFGWEYAWRCWGARGQEEQTRVYLWAGREFCERVLQEGFGEAGGVYTFNSAGLELLEEAKRQGLLGVVEQIIAPVQIMDQLLAEEMDAHPGWERPAKGGQARGEFAAREQAEWECASLIVCGSEFVRRGIVECGGPGGRCVVVPYGVNATLLRDRQQRAQGGKLRVLVAGELGLRKGAPYVLQAACTTKGLAEFRWCGGGAVLPAAAMKLNENVELRGAVPRPLMAENYAWADVFLLPSICEGSATVCYEALAAGLPVITTENAGSVVRDGVEGFIVPARNAGAIVERLEMLSRDRELLESMSRRAIRRALEFTVEKYGERLLAALAAPCGELSVQRLGSNC